MLIAITKNIIAMIDSPNKSDRDFALDIIGHGKLSSKTMSDLYNYYLVEKSKWIYKDNWVKIRQLLKQWQEKQLN